VLRALLAGCDPRVGAKSLMIHIPAYISRVPIVRGVLRLLITAYSHVFKGRYSLERRMGLLLLLDRENAIDWQLMLSGEWERPHLTKLFDLAKRQLPYCKNGAVFLDIGAHWGLYALKARQTGMFSQIVAFEPDPQNYSQLQANLFLNAAHAKIRALQLAATDADRDFKLFQRTVVASTARSMFPIPCSPSRSTSNRTSSRQSPECRNCSRRTGSSCR
jgi:hypothetical protein